MGANSTTIRDERVNQIRDTNYMMMESVQAPYGNVQYMQVVCGNTEMQCLCYIGLTEGGAG